MAGGWGEGAGGAGAGAAGVLVTLTDDEVGLGVGGLEGTLTFVEVGATLVEEELTGGGAKVVGATFTAGLETLTRDGGVVTAFAEVNATLELELVTTGFCEAGVTAAGGEVTEGAAVEEAGGTGAAGVLEGTVAGTLVGNRSRTRLGHA